MRHFTVEYVSKLGIFTQGRSPAPFPGEFPTRIAWRFRAVGRGKEAGKFFDEEYLGKPNGLAVCRLRNLEARFAAKGWRPNIETWEFDRKVVILRSFFNPVMGLDEVTAVETLMAAYHPWQAFGRRLDHFLPEIFIKNIGGFRVYATTKMLKTEFITSYKAWMLNNIGKRLKAKAERDGEKAAIKLEKAAADRRKYAGYGYGV